MKMRLERMKVFISWSGTKSHKVALVFRDWLPSVIQSLEPYVSSEDIDKGARWSTDIAKELEDSTFGILCVTKENIDAPWLSFEAGALSKTMDKSFVSPFLFDIKRSEVNGPILQFQSTIFQKTDIQKLLTTLNKACGDGCIPERMLAKAFEVWYPTLEEELNKIKDVEETKEVMGTSQTDSHTSEILEEILDLSRNNQKLLRSPDEEIYKRLDEINKKTADLLLQRDREIEMKRMSRKVHPMMMEELLHHTMNETQNPYAFLVSLSIFKEDSPWIYDAGKELIDTLKSKVSESEKKAAVYSFEELIDFTLNHPMMRDVYGKRKEYMMFMRDFQYAIEKYLDTFEKNN